MARQRPEFYAVPQGSPVLFLDKARFEKSLRVWLETVTDEQIEAIERSLIGELIERRLPGWDAMAKALSELERHAEAGR